MTSRFGIGTSTESRLLNRRTYLAASGTTALTAVGGCLGDDDEEDDDSTEPTDDHTDGEPADDPELVQISMVPVVGTQPFYVAMEEGYLAERNIELEITRTAGGAEATNQMAVGELDGVGGAIGASTINLILEGADVSVVADRSRNRPGLPNPQAFVIGGHVYEEGMTVGDTAGMTWGNNGFGNVNEFMIARALRAHDLSIDDIEIEVMGFPQMIGALAEGAIDIAATVAGFIPQSIEASDGALLAYTAQYNPENQVASQIFSDQFINERWDTAVKTLEAYFLGQRKMMAEGFYSDYNARIWEEHTDNPPEVLRSTPFMWWDRNGGVNEESLVRQQEFWECRGYTDGVVPPDQLINSELREEALETIGRVEDGLATPEEYNAWREDMIIDLPDEIPITPPETDVCGGAGEVEER